uniref:Uncharacterized protein n=1 Tax=Oryza punctata TaxID=4537 RepID=A0A0E0LD13_ORYPU
MAPVCSATADVPPAAPGGDPRATPASRPPAVSDRDPTAAAPPAVVDLQPSDCPCPQRIPDGRNGVDEPIRDDPPPRGRAWTGSRFPASLRRPHVPVEPVHDNPPSTHMNKPLALGTDEKKPENHHPPAAQVAPPVVVIPHPSPTNGPITEPIKDNPTSVFSHLSLTHGPGGLPPAPTEPIKDNP